MQESTVWEVRFRPTAAGIEGFKVSVEAPNIVRAIRLAMKWWVCGWDEQDGEIPKLHSDLELNASLLPVSVKKIGSVVVDKITPTSPPF